MSFALAPLAVGFVFGPCLHAADESTEESSDTTEEGEEESVLKTWTGTFGEDVMGGVIVLRLDHLVSVSIHNYMLNGTKPVSELTIDTKGNCTIRLHAAIPLTEMVTLTKQEVYNTKNAAKNEAKSQVGQPAYTVDDAASQLPPLTKQYPLTTHSHNIEYIMGDYRQLELIYNSIVSAMVSGEETVYTINN